jgi:hypothetical protein
VPDESAKPAKYRAKLQGTSRVVTEATTKLEQAIQQAASQYFRLAILAGAPASGKTAALQSVAQKLGCQLVNVNLEVSKRMLELTRTQRSRQVERLVNEVIAAAPGDVVLLRRGVAPRMAASGPTVGGTSRPAVAMGRVPRRRRANGLGRIAGYGGRCLRPVDDAALRLVAQSAISRATGYGPPDFPLHGG